MARAAEVVLEVTSQERSREMWAAALATRPTLDVPAMAAVNLSALRLGARH